MIYVNQNNSLFDPIQQFNIIGITVDGIGSFSPKEFFRFNQKWVHLCMAISFSRNVLSLFTNGKNVGKIKILRFVFFSISHYLF